MVTGLVLAEVGLPPVADQDVTEEERMAVFQAMTPDTFPNLVEAFTTVEFSVERQFELGMEWLTSGMESTRPLEVGDCRDRVAVGRTPPDWDHAET
jgi:hypothetical protein